MTTGNRQKVLDHGYVDLVDYMGDDNSTLIAARMSTSNATGADETKDSRLRNRLWADQHTCYDDRTQVLTADGFKRWGQVTPTTVLGIWDPIKGSLCFETPKEVIHQKYQGDMHRVRHGGVDLLVTPNHKMWVKLRTGAGGSDWTDYRLIEAQRLGDRSMVRYCKLAPFFEEDSEAVRFLKPFGKYDITALLELIGFFIGDGCRPSVNHLIFHLKKQRKIDYLTNVCNRLGLPLEVKEGWRDAKRFYIKFENADNLFNCFYKKGKKFIPKELRILHHDRANALLEGLKNSDGSVKRGTWQFSTSVKSVAKATQLIALCAGQAAHLRQSLDGTWNVMFLSRMREPVINQGKKNTSIEDYEGMIHCAATRTGVLVVRRNGKICLSGNSPFEMAELVFEIQCPIFALRQIDRHRTIGYPGEHDVVDSVDDVVRNFMSRNEFSGRYSIMEDLFYIPDESRIAGTDPTNKQGSRGLLPEETRARAVATIKGVRDAVWTAYTELIGMGVANEIARVVLQLNQYTKLRLKGNLLNWLKFLDLRLRLDVQWETRVYAQAIAKLLRKKFPQSWEVFEEHTLYGTRLSRSEVQFLRRVLMAHSVTNEMPQNLAKKLVEPIDLLS